MEKVDYLDWLTNQENFIMWNIFGSGGTEREFKDWAEELNVVRELKGIVESYCKGKK